MQYKLNVISQISQGENWDRVVALVYISFEKKGKEATSGVLPCWCLPFRLDSTQDSSPTQHVRTYSERNNISAQQRKPPLAHNAMGN